MRSDFEAFKTRYGGGFLNDANDDSDKLLHTVAWDAWQAATALERDGCAKVCIKRNMGDCSREDQEAVNCAAAIQRRGDA